jgi:hypothetical protein
MNQTFQRVGEERRETSASNSADRLSFLKFLMRYPIFLLAFGPPILRSSGIDATKGVIDLWSVLQVGLLSSIALRAVLRLALTRAILIPKQIRSVLKLAFLLGMLFLASVAYSPSRRVSLAYSIGYFLALVCVVEFIADAYKNPPNWMQCVFHLRHIALLLLALDFIVLIFNSRLVINVEEGSRVRFGGGLVGPFALICPMIAIISAYAFMHSLEPKARSAFFFLVGLAGTLSTQSRGCELALLFTLSFLALRWAKTGRRTAYIFISGFLASMLFLSVILGAVGGGSIWRIVNRGESVEGIVSASGRTAMWRFVIQYCLKHPQGMGYVAGFRMIFREQSATALHLIPTSIGNAHNGYFQVLADAGWLALAIYLIMLTKIVRLALCFASKTPHPGFTSDNLTRESIECFMLMLIYCLAEGMDTSGLVVPLSVSTYWQNIIIAIILSSSARQILASRIPCLEPVE